MGMISRVRARVHAAPPNNPRDKEEKTAQTVCLLSVVALLPYLARSQASILVGSVGLGYSCLVLPVVISVNYKYPPSGAIPFLTKCTETFERLIRPFKGILRKVYAPIQRAETVFLKMHNISTMVNQLVFFTLCDKVLLPGQRMTNLYSLMFYNVIAYCVGYIRELINKEDWSPYVMVTEQSNVKHLAMSATKIVLEWTKAVTFVMTVVFMLLVFGLEQGLNNYQPSTLYMAITWLYYMATEKVIVEMFPTVLQWLQLSALEALETLWAPVIARAFTVAASALLAATLLLHGQYRLVLFAIYLNVFLRVKQMRGDCLAALNKERAVLQQFRYATREELQEFDDVCAVCLSTMRIARITPCHHMFHGECLRQCLKSSVHCPICKRELKLD